MNRYASMHKIHESINSRKNITMFKLKNSRANLHMFFYIEVLQFHKIITNVCFVKNLTLMPKHFSFLEKAMQILLFVYVNCCIWSPNTTKFGILLEKKYSQRIITVTQDTSLRMALTFADKLLQRQFFFDSMLRNCIVCKFSVN
jgi:hypothetical protein